MTDDNAPMAPGVQQRHKALIELEQSRDLIVACAPLRSNINLSHIVRAAGCSGIRTVICCGPVKVHANIARDGAESVEIRMYRTLAPPLRELKLQGFQLVGLEQTTASVCLSSFPFVRRTVLVVGNERQGLDAEILQLLDAVVEIPMYGLPYSHNVATAAAIAVYEFCRQFPRG